MERQDSPSSDRARQRLDDLSIVDFMEVAIVAPDGEIALVRGDEDRDVVALTTDELDGFRRRDGDGADDSSGARTPRVRDGALHRRGRRDAVVDDDDISTLDRHRRRVASDAQLEVARPLRLFLEERRHRTAEIFFRIRRDDRFAGRRDGTEREFGLPRMTDFADDDDVEISVERERDGVRDDDSPARDAEDEWIALGCEQRCERTTGLRAVNEQEAACLQAEP